MEWERIILDEGKDYEMKRQYLVTERAHFMCPNMHFGMLMEIEKEYIEENVKETLDRMANAHPFLNTRMEQTNYIIK